jgi:hypothetical protein
MRRFVNDQPHPGNRFRGARIVSNTFQRRLAKAEHLLPLMLPAHFTPGREKNELVATVNKIR